MAQKTKRNDINFAGKNPKTHYGGKCTVETAAAAPLHTMHKGIPKFVHEFGKQCQSCIYFNNTNGTLPSTAECAARRESVLCVLRIKFAARSISQASSAAEMKRHSVTGSRSLRNILPLE